MSEQPVDPVEPDDVEPTESEPDTQQPSEAAPEPQVITHHTEQQGDWLLVRIGTWEVSVGPDGVMRLPTHLHPREVDDFLAAITHAARLGTDIAARYQAALEAADKTPLKGRAVVTERGQTPPSGPGVIPLTGIPRGQIGRPRGVPRRR